MSMPRRCYAVDAASVAHEHQLLNRELPLLKENL